jgi:hypothetical protein
MTGIPEHALGHADPNAPSVPRLQFAFEILAEVNPPVTAGPGANGERKHIVITGGTLRGPLLNGRILPGGSDWLWQRPDGTAEIHAHYTVQLDDGTPVYLRNLGLRHAEPAVLARLRAGEQVPASEYYFRTAPVFDAPDGPHAWLRNRCFVGSARPGPGVVRIMVYLVT